VKYSIRRAEIRVVLGSRPGCSFYVRDNGCGFPQARAADIFRPFHRLHDPREYEGTGIGLATVARIVARHAGRVWAEGEEDWGATVYVALPPAA
jgi:signal transduction histidine kinase